MDKETNNNIFEKILSVIGILILVILILYVIYKVILSKNIFNTDETISTDNTILENEVNDSSSTPIEKEPVFVETELASFTSTLYDNSENRMFNIQKATEILNNTTLKAGEEFSFNNTVGQMGEENGYKKANGFDSNGKIIQIAGAGMCQISSTVYNVALLSNMQITERHPHSRRVYYVPQDKDATVYYPDLDLKFINTTGYDIKIYSSTDNYSVTVTFKKIEQSN